MIFIQSKFYRCLLKCAFVFAVILQSNQIGAQTLHLFGGRNHDVYLGCINCGKYESSSIWNEYGDYGSKYNRNSIWNEYGDYGNSYNSNCPWNAYASNPPMVVDLDGNFYGYLSVNEYQSKRADFSLAMTLCRFHKLIRENVAEWYDEIFE
jgi:hypothetical protein